MRRPPPTADRLLAAATEAFAAYGFEGASTHAIAEAVGAPQGLVRHHFGSKEGLWAAAVDRGLASLSADLESCGPLTVAAWVAALERHAELAGVLVQALLEGGPRADRVAQKVRPLVDRLLGLVRRAQPHASEDVLFAWLGATLAGPLLRRLSSAPRPELRSATARHEIDLLFAWLTTARAPQQAGPFALQTARSHLRGND